MGEFLHRISKFHYKSTPPDALPEPVDNYISQPDLSGVAGVPSMYWNINGDVITEMTGPEKTVVDAALTASQIISNKEIVGSEPDGVEATSHEVRAILHNANKRDNFLVNRIIELQDQMSAIAASTGNVQSVRDAVASIQNSSTQTRALGQAIADYAAEVASGDTDTR